MELKWLLLLVAAVVALNTLTFGGHPLNHDTHGEVNGWSSAITVDGSGDRRSLTAVPQQLAAMAEARAAAAAAASSAQAETELLCADRPDLEGGCHAW